MCAAYDSPGFDSPLFGGMHGFDRAWAAPGSEGGGAGPLSVQGADPDAVTGMPSTGVIVRVVNSDGGGNAGVASDVLPGVHDELAKNSYTGVGGADSSGAGEGSAGHFRHPSSLGAGHS